MKQSTKLLSLVLAIVMAFSCMTVIGNAADTLNSANKITYDSIDDALLTQNYCFTFSFIQQAHAYFCIGVLKIWR